MLTRPTLMEGEATHRAIRLSELAEVPLYVVHLSAAEALAALTEARDRGIPVHAETCAHYLFLTNVEYDRPGFDAAKYVMTPPLVELTATTGEAVRPFSEKGHDRRRIGRRHRAVRP